MVNLLNNFKDLTKIILIILSESDFLINIFHLINSNLWIILSCEILIISLTVLMASRVSPQIFKGLKGIAIITIIGRAVYEGNKECKAQGTNEGNNTDTDKYSESDLKIKMTRSTYKSNEK